MNSVRRQPIRLTSRAFTLRLAAVAAIALGGLVFRRLDPISLSWLPLRTSCGAVTGLPCLFCGTTRALHHLLNGEFARALYFNWLAFVVAAAAVVLALILAAELLFRRRLLFIPDLQPTPRLAVGAAAGVVALWILQVTLAVSFHKQELLNSNGVFYALFSR